MSSELELDDECATVLLSLAHSSIEKLDSYPTASEMGNFDWENKLRNIRRIKVSKEKYYFTIAKYIRLMTDKAEEVRKLFKERGIPLSDKKLRQYLDDYEKMFVVNDIMRIIDS